MYVERVNELQKFSEGYCVPCAAAALTYTVYLAFRIHELMRTDTTSLGLKLSIPGYDTCLAFSD